MPLLHWFTPFGQIVYFYSLCLCVCRTRKGTNIIYTEYIVANVTNVGVRSITTSTAEVHLVLLGLCTEEFKNGETVVVSKSISIGKCPSITSLTQPIPGFDLNGDIHIAEHERGFTFVCTYENAIFVLKRIMKEEQVSM